MIWKWETQVDRSSERTSVWIQSVRQPYPAYGQKGEIVEEGSHHQKVRNAGG